MATLKQKAIGKSKSKLAPPQADMTAPANNSESLASQPGAAPMFDAPPPLLPPAYSYIKLFATIPGLRKKAGMGPI